MIKKQKTLRSKKMMVSSRPSPFKATTKKNKAGIEIVQSPFNAELIRDLYEKAYQIYSAGHYEQAKSLFGSLSLFDPRDSQFLYGYATCCYMLHEYEQAADCFIRCGSLDPANPVPFFYAADCYMQRHDLLSTCMALKVALKRADDQPEFAEIKQRAQTTLEALTPNRH